MHGYSGIRRRLYQWTAALALPLALYGGCSPTASERKMISMDSIAYRPLYEMGDYLIRATRPSQTPESGLYSNSAPDPDGVVWEFTAIDKDLNNSFTPGDVFGLRVHSKDKPIDCEFTYKDEGFDQNCTRLPSTFPPDSIEVSLPIIYRHTGLEQRYHIFDEHDGVRIPSDSELFSLLRFMGTCLLNNPERDAYRADPPEGDLYIARREIPSGIWVVAGQDHNQDHVFGRDDSVTTESRRRGTMPSTSLIIEDTVFLFRFTDRGDHFYQTPDPRTDLSTLQSPNDFIPDVYHELQRDCRSELSQERHKEQV